jgi:uncharacterized membrane protein
MSDGTPPPENVPGADAGGTPPPPPPAYPPTQPPAQSPGQPGGYGAAPPPPPPPAPGAGGAYSAPDAFSYGWARFKSKPAELLVPFLVVLVLLIVVEIVVQVILRHSLLGTHSCNRTIFGETVQAQCGPSFFVQLLGTALAGLFISLVSQAVGAGLIKNALNIADGGEASISEIGAWATKGPVIVTALIVAVATAVGTVLCYLPGLIVGFLLNWAMFYVVDEGLAPMDAIKASISFSTSHLGETIVFYLLGIVVIVVGAILCLVGLLVAIPVLLVAAAFTFRVLNGKQVAPVA